MGIELFWDNDEQTVLLCEFHNRWTWDEMFDTLNTIKKITDNVDYEIGAIVDVRSAVSFPGGSFMTIDNFDKAKRLLKMGEDGTGPIVFVGANTVIKTIYNTMASLNPSAASSIYFADTLKQARAHLSERMPVKPY